eukprot:TRINITY_DN11486_c0_g1_i1.p1 TRINITY_DN11486_c0_g1~~TRINITY_DN11486_c0_g1_i1.p1  ORF type:complete len:295 (-),score=28.66 TRINITY_DN11486_c0_g1_i1:164-1027(-)
MACEKGFTDQSKCYEYNLGYCKHSLMVVGPTGAGKSAFCNFILGEKKFKETTGFIAGTGTADHDVMPCVDGDLLVVDCPGFCDPKLLPNEIIDEITKASIICSDGMDAIGIVIDPTSRFTESQKVACEQMELFGGDFWKHTFIIFNRENQILEDFDISDARLMIDQIKNDPNCPEAFISFMDKVGNRFIFVESKKRWHDEVYRQQVKDNLLAVVLQLKENNNGRYFNCFIEQAKMELEALSVSRIKQAAEIVSLKAQNEKMEKARIALEAQVKELLEKGDKRRCTIL